MQSSHSCWKLNMKLVLIFAAVLGAALAAPSLRNLYKNPPSAQKPRYTSARIANGTEAKPNSIPYQAFIELHGLGTGWYCGGTLIAPDLVLTAAHCGDTAEHVVVTLGAHKVFTSEPTQVIVRSETIIVHEDFDMPTALNDITLIKLPEKVESTEAIWPVKLPGKDNNTYAGETGRISGWGYTDRYDHTPSKVLLYAENKILPNDECKSILGPEPDQRMCLSGEGYRTTCLVDSGGPLVVNDIQVGIISYATGFCIEAFASPYTRVSSFLDWIEKKQNSF